MGVAVALDPTLDPIAPGSEAGQTVRIRNTGAVVDQFDLDVLGDAASWASVEPSRINLMPGEEGTARLVFNPPRSSGIGAGPVAFALRVMSHEDLDGSAVQESTVVVDSFSQVTAELVPRTSYGRLAGRHELALDNLGNHPELVSVTVSDPDRLLTFRVNPANPTVEAGTATFVKVKAKPKKTIWIGASKTIPFGVAVTGADSDQTTVQGSMLQQPVFPPWFFRALLAAIAILIALIILWFVLLKPSIASTAKAAAEDHTDDLVQAIEDGNKQAAEAAKAAAEAQKTSETAESKSDKASQDVKEIQEGAAGGGSSSGPNSGGTLDASAASDFRITTSAATGGDFSSFEQDVPKDKIIWISDIVLQNPAGDSGVLRIQRGDQVLFEFGLENFRDLDYHLIQPIRFTDTEDVVVAVNCANAAEDCTPSVYFTGRITNVPKKATN